MTEQETKSVYRRNKASYDDWCGSERTQRDNWQRWGGVSMCLNVVLAGGLIYAATLPKQVVRLLMVYPEKGIVRVADPKDQKALTDSDWKDIKYTAVRDFVNYWRTVTSDQQLQKQFWDAAPRFVGKGSQANHLLDEWRSAHNPLVRGTKEIVSLRILSHGSITDNTYQMTWEESTYALTGGLKSKTVYQATFTYAVNGPPSNAAVANDNPFGILITEINLSKLHSTQDEQL